MQTTNPPRRHVCAGWVLILHYWMTCGIGSLTVIVIVDRDLQLVHSIFWVVLFNLPAHRGEDFKLVSEAFVLVC